VPRTAAVYAALTIDFAAFPMLYGMAMRFTTPREDRRRRVRSAEWQQAMTETKIDEEIGLLRRDHDNRLARNGLHASGHVSVADAVLTDQAAKICGRVGCRKETAWISCPSDHRHPCPIKAPRGALSAD